MMQAYFPAFLFLLMIAGCTSNSKQEVVLEEEKSITLLTDSSLAYSSLEIVKDGDHNLVALYDFEQHTELFFDVNGNPFSHIALAIPDSHAAGSRPYIKVISPRSVAALWPSMRDVFLFDGEGKVEKKISATVPLADGQSDYCLVAMSNSPVLPDGKNIFVTCTRLDVVLRNPEARKKYFSTPPDLRLGISNNDQKNSGVWPQEYKDGISYRDFYPQRCANENGEIVYGFSASDSIFIMKNDVLVAAYKCKSSYMTERHAYPDDSLGHFSFLEKYTVTEPRYLNLIYDGYRKYYYRIVSHAIEYEAPGGMTVRTNFDKPWSIMVMNEKFDVLSEIKMDESRFIPVVLPVKDGLLVKKRQQKNAVAPVSFSLFKIHT